MKGKSWRFVITAVVLAVALGLSISGNALASDKKPYRIEIYTFKVGTFTYAAGVALAELINKNSTWLKASAATRHPRASSGLACFH